MCIEQYHFQQSGPSWGKIAIVSLIVISASLIVYKLGAIKPIKIEPQPEKEKESGQENIRENQDQEKSVK